MCGQCYATGAVAAETAMLVGAPVAYALYRRARRALGLPDTAVAPAERHLPRRPPRIPRITSPATLVSSGRRSERLGGAGVARSRTPSAFAASRPRRRGDHRLPHPARPRVSPRS